MPRLVAILLTHPRVLDDPRTRLTICLPLIATSICCYLVIRHPLAFRRALLLAGLFAIPIVAPLYQWLNAPSGVSYPLDELGEVLFAASFPFLAIAVLRCFLRKNA